MKIPVKIMKIQMKIWKEKKPRKTIYVEGICKHCKARVEKKTLKDFEQVDDAVVDLDNKLVEVTFNADVDNQVLTDAIVDAGYEVTSIEG